MVGTDTPREPSDRPDPGSRELSSASGAGAEGGGAGSPTRPAVEGVPRQGAPEPPAWPRPAPPHPAAPATAPELAQIARLEQFRLAIERLRREREATIAEFRAFVREGAAAARRQAGAAAAAAPVPAPISERSEAVAARLGAPAPAPSPRQPEPILEATGHPAGAVVEPMERESVEVPGAAATAAESISESLPGEAVSVPAAAVAAAPAQEEARQGGAAAGEPAAQGVFFDFVEPEAARVPAARPVPLPAREEPPATAPGPLFAATLEEAPAPSAGRRIAIWTTGLLVAAAAVFLFVRPVGEPPGPAPVAGGARQEPAIPPGAAGGTAPVAQVPAPPLAAPTAPGAPPGVAPAVPEGVRPEPAIIGRPTLPATAAPGEASPAGAARVPGFEAGPTTAQPPFASVPPAVSVTSVAPGQAVGPQGGATAGPGSGAALPQPTPLRVEILTERPVWIRAVADDVRRFERLVPENQRIAVDARAFVLLRIGDGGAVRLIVNGVDRGLQGRDGQVVTRRFDAGAAPTVPR